MINVNEIWTSKKTGEEVLIMRVADIYVLYQNAQGDIANRHPMIFLQDFINLEGMERKDDSALSCAKCGSCNHNSFDCLDCATTQRQNDGMKTIKVSIGDL